MENKDKHRVQYFLICGEHQDLCESDLIVRDGVHVVVLEWAEPNQDEPAVFLPLDPAHLQAPTQADGLFRYSVPLVDPRKPA